jgi:type 1 glutamine amidotransferase
MNTETNPNRPSRLPVGALTRALVCLFVAAGGVWFAAARPPADPAPAKPRARVLLVTGVDYPGHLWRQTAPLLAETLRKDPRLEVFTIEDPQFLDSSALARYDVVVLHFENWDHPAPGPNARANLRQFVEGGKGVVLLHFACGAWHDEWPEFVNIAGRVWAGQKVRQHDSYGPFRVEIVKPDHPLMHGMADFDTQDELYTCLTGDVPIEVLAQAKSKVDGKYYPMVFVSNCGKGRSFHCTLGHDVKALSTPSVQELFRRACAWAAGLPPEPARH